MNFRLIQPKSICGYSSPSDGWARIHAFGFAGDQQEDLVATSFSTAARWARAAAAVRKPSPNPASWARVNFWSGLIESQAFGIQIVSWDRAVPAKNRDGPSLYRPISKAPVSSQSPGGNDTPQMLRGSTSSIPQSSGFSGSI
jgi:hypothetical protein